MKILILQDFLRSGGTERQSILLANAFSAAGHPTTLVTFRPGGTLRPSVNAGVQPIALQPFDFRLDWFAPRLIATVRKAKPDIVLCMGRMANCYAGTLQQKMPDATVLATMRTGKSLPGLFRRSLQSVRHVVANSRDARDTLVNQHAVPRQKISVIHNSLVFPSLARNPDAPSPLRDQLRAQHGAGPSTLVLLCVAMFRPEKNQRELVEIAAGLPSQADWQLWLAGDGPARASCAQLAASKGLAARVKFVGFHRDPSSLYHASDLAVHASWSEALSNFLIEAQAHGLPAVAYQAQGIEECFIPNHTGWAIPRDHRDAFRAALMKYFVQPIAVKKQTAANARTYARDTFDPGRQVAAYLDLFTQLQQASPRSLPPHAA